MRTALFYDTETQCLPLFSEPSEDPRQPHIVQLGARLVDLDTRKVISTLDVICRPEGWEIPAETTAIHGITTEHAKLFGVSESMAVGTFMELWDAADLRIAHNEIFDMRILRIALMRHGTRPQEEADAWKAGAAECTASLSSPICKLPPTPKMVAARRNHPKTPNLGEAYRFFTGRELEGAHSALVDVDACMAVWFAIKSGQREAAVV